MSVVNGKGKVPDPTWKHSTLTKRGWMILTVPAVVGHILLFAGLILSLLFSIRESLPIGISAFLYVGAVGFLPILAGLLIRFSRGLIPPEQQKPGQVYLTFGLGIGGLVWEMGTGFLCLCRYLFQAEHSAFLMGTLMVLLFGALIAFIPEWIMFRSWR